MDLESSRLIGNIVLPAAPNLGVAPAHQEPVAGASGVALGCTIDVLQGQRIAPVHHVEEQFMVAFLRVHGLQDPEVCRELHQPCRVLGSKLQVGDQAIRGIVWATAKWAVPFNCS